MIHDTEEEIEQIRRDNARNGELLDEIDGLTHHEALHASSMIIDIIDRGLLQHHAVYVDRKAFKLAYDAHTAVFNLYQYLGSMKS